MLSFLIQWINHLKNIIFLEIVFKFMDLKEKIAIIHNLMRVKKFTQAIINCHKLIKLHPDISYLYNLCGMAYQGNNK